MELEAGREYRFRYLFDGDQWRDDWHADKYIMDPYGKYHSSTVIIKVPPETRCVESWREEPVPSDATLKHIIAA